MQNIKEELLTDDWLLAVASLLVEDGDVEGFFKLLKEHPELVDILWAEPTDNEIDVELSPTEISFERLKQRLIADGVWR